MFLLQHVSFQVFSRFLNGRETKKEIFHHLLLEAENN